MGSALVRKLMKRQAIAGSLVFRAWKNARQCWAENSHLDPTRAPAPLSPSKFLSNQADPPLRNWLTPSQVLSYPPGHSPKGPLCRLWTFGGCVSSQRFITLATFLSNRFARLRLKQRFKTSDNVRLNK